MIGVQGIRDEFVQLLKCEDYVTDKGGGLVLELTGATFNANEPLIFGEVNNEYVERELKWYESMSLNVQDIPGGPPKVWEAVASKEGKINSNYGWMIWNADNHLQYWNVLLELKKNPTSRRAVMIYTRPSIWREYDHNGMSDFICTNTVQYFIRNNYLDVVVQMRSNDVWAGYRNDYAWQRHVQQRLAKELGVDVGCIVWQVGSLHVYEKNFYLVDYYDKTGKTQVTKATYRELYPESRFSK